MKRLVLGSLLALALLLLTNLIAQAEEITCQGFLGAVTVDNLRVPQNASCVLNKTKIEGTIKVETGASLTARQVTVIGNVQAEGAKVVRVLAGSTVGGSLQLKQGGAAEVDLAYINGDILFDTNTQPLSARRTQVGGNVQVFQNTGGVALTQNLIDGNLQCKENNPAPTGGNNLVQGNQEDQCADLGSQLKQQIFIPLIGGNINTPGSETPETTINSRPATTTTSPNATFTFSASKPGSTFECALDGMILTSCLSPMQLTGLAAGAHTFQVWAIDSAGNLDPTPASYTWTVQASAGCGAPVTLFAEADSWIDQNSAFNNFGTDAILKVRSQSPSDNFRALIRFALPTGMPQGCVVQSATLRLYAASWTDGRTLEVLRVANTWSESLVTWNNQPATTGTAVTTSSGSGYREWNVAAQVQAIYDTSSNYGFLIRDAVEGGTGQEQQFHSREKDEKPPMLIIQFGASGPVDTTPPETTISSGPVTTTTNTSATFTFSANEPGSSFECSLDGVAFATCVSPQEYTNLSAGSHLFLVRAIDGTGNLDPTPASYTWTIQASVSCGAPVTLLAGADSWIDQNSASNNFGTDAILKVRSQSPGDNFRALVQFPLPTNLPEGCVVQSATLRLYAASWTDSRTLEVLRLASAWSESLVTWNNQPATTGTAVTTGSGSGYREWNVAAQVQAIYDTGSNHGFLIRDTVEGGSGQEQQFHSREKSENPPELVISFAQAGE